MDYKFSVAMSVYKNDQPNYFKQAIDSIIKQTLTPNEIILVIDGPISDELKNVVDTYENTIDKINVIINDCITHFIFECSFLLS